jgi:hypothetical protein
VEAAEEVEMAAPVRAERSLQPPRFRSRRSCSIAIPFEAAEPEMGVAVDRVQLKQAAAGPVVRAVLEAAPGVERLSRREVHF